MSKFKVNQPVVHIPSFKEYEATLQWRINGVKSIFEVSFVQGSTIGRLHRPKIPEGEQAPYGVEKPVETQEATGNLCSAQNATGTCQSGTCAFTCQEGFSDCDSDLTNGCETATSTCPTP